MEQEISFLNEQGKKLYGIVHVPDGTVPESKRIGINLLNPGIKYRVAPNRLNVKLARTLCSKGYYVLRFDPAGIGDSEGELASGDLITNIWGRIQTGMFISDVKCSNRLFMEKYGLDKLFLIGNCGGAITALLSSGGFHQPDGLILIDIPITIDGDNKSSSYAENISAGGAYSNKAFRGYVQNLTSMESWWRLLTLKSDFKAMAAALNSMVTKKVLRRETKDYEIKHLNHEAVNTLDSYLAKYKRVLFILAGNDANSSVLLNKFFPKYLREYSRSSDQIRVRVVEHANHIYAWYPWQEQLFSLICDWLANVNQNN
jgi:uncharacterized protein